MKPRCNPAAGCVPAAVVRLPAGSTRIQPDGTVTATLTPMQIVNLKTELDFALEALRA